MKTPYKVNQGSLLIPFIFYVFVMLTPLLSGAQSKIAGKITEKTSGLALSDVTVFVKGSALAVSTDSAGNYELLVMPNSYNLTIQYIQYKEITLTGVIVKPNETVYLDIAMEELSTSGKDLDAVTVVGKAKESSFEAINIARKNQVAVGDGITTSQFTKTAARSVSDILKQVSGTSIQENKFAIIRGMNDRYNSAYLNGAPLPSTESDRKAFAFNIIPANLIDNLMIYKAPSPDMMGDFAGGIIMINTKSIPATKTSILNFSIGTHSLTTFQNFSHFRTSRTDVFGFDNGTRSLPELKLYREGQEKNIYVDFTKKLNNDWKIYDKQALPNSNLSYSWGNNFKHNKNSFGTLASFTYSNNNRFTQSVQQKFRYEDNNLDQCFLDKQYTNTVAFGAILNFGYTFKKKHVIALKNLFNQNADDITTNRTGLSSGENLYYSRSYSNIYSQNRILSTQITGEHILFTKKHRLNWVLNAGNIFRSMPDYRIASYSGEGDNSNAYSLAVNNNQFAASSGRFYSDMSERIFSGTMSYSIPFKFKITKNEFKTGVFSQLRNREFNSRYFTYYGPWGITGTPDVNLGANNINDNGVYLVEQSSPSRDNYDASSKLNAVYAMMDTRLFKNLRLVYGSRLESYHQQINTSDATNLPLVIDSIYINFLPSINMTWNITEKANLRLSGGKTVNRPEFRELAAFPFYNFNLNSNIAGNTHLLPAKIWNYDLRWEWFPSSKEVVSAGVFYKKITNPIEMSIDITQVAIRTFGYSNQKNAENYGIELEYRKSFGFISKATGQKFWENLTFFTNLALVKSTIQFTDLSAAMTNRPLQGQSPFVLNMGLQFNDVKNGWGANIYYNKIGRRIAFVGAPKLAKYGFDIFENTRTVIDFQLNKSVKKWEYKLTIGDVLAQDMIFYQDLDADKYYSNAKDNTIFKYSLGQTVTAAIAFKFH